MLQQADNLHAVLVAAAFALRRDRGDGGVGRVEMWRVAVG
jgi:hypothetical protein